MASFSTPRVHVNADGWGPTTLPEQYVGVPFTPFGKGDRLGKAADFLGHYRYNNYRNQQGGAGGAAGNADFAYEHEQDGSFNLVDTTKAPSNRGRRGRWRGRGRGGWRGRGRGRGGRRGEEAKPIPKGKAAKYLLQQKRGKQWNRRPIRRNWNRRRRGNENQLEASVKVQADWAVLEQFDLSALAKMALKPPTPEDLLWAGELAPYIESYDRVSVKKPSKLERCEDILFQNVTTMDDPVIQKFAQEAKGNVFATDEVMAHLMVCSRSVKPWDLVFTRIDDGEGEEVKRVLFIDKRENSNLEMLSVNETSTYQRPDEDKVPLQEYNKPEALSVEATAINQNFSQQVVNRDDPKHIKKFENENPFWDEEDEDEGKPPSIAYRYRKWDLGSGLELVARTELHGKVKKKKEKKFCTIFALNEWDSKLAVAVDWRQKLDQSRGAVLATELKNNSNKLGKWTAQTLLAGADLMKIGYVSRQNVRDPSKHQILGTQFYKPVSNFAAPTEFAVQINLSQKNMWGVLKMLIDLAMKQKQGKYVLLKDPNKPLLRLYEVPMDTFDDSDDDDEDEEEDGEIEVDSD